MQGGRSQNFFDLRPKASKIEGWSVRSSQILEIGHGLQQNEVLMNNRYFFNTNYEHVSVLMFFFHHQIIGTEHILKRLSVSDFNPTIFLLKGLQVAYQSSFENSRVLKDVASMEIWTQFLTSNLRSKSWWLVEKKGLRRSGFCLGVLECRKERWKASLNIFDLSSHIWRLMIRRFDDCDGVASHWLAIRIERKLTHSRRRLVSRMKTRRCEQPHTMNSCKRMRNSRFFLACMSQTCIVWYVCFGGGKGRTVVIPLKLRVTERSATSLQDLHMRSKMHSTAEPLENNGNR